MKILPSECSRRRCKAMEVSQAGDLLDTNHELAGAMQRNTHLPCAVAKPPIVSATPREELSILGHSLRSQRMSHRACQ